jgi:acyl carrier protein
MKENIENVVKTIIKEIIPDLTEIDIHSEFNDIPGWSSITYVLFVSKIEEFYSMKLTSDDLFDLETVNDVIVTISKKIK